MKTQNPKLAKFYKEMYAIGGWEQEVLAPRVYFFAKIGKFGNELATDYYKM